MLKRIGEVIHDDTQYLKGALGIRTQKCFAVKVVKLPACLNLREFVLISSLVQHFDINYSMCLLLCCIFGNPFV